MSIVTLRVNKGSALTYDEMDRNLASFYYSSSMHSEGTVLRLHYTGSNTLDTGSADFGPRYTDIAIGGEFSGSIASNNPSGVDGNIQYKVGTGFGATGTFTYDTVNKKLGIGTASPATKLQVGGDNSQAGIIRISSTITNNSFKKAFVEFTQGSTVIGSVGRTSELDDNIYLFSNASTIFKIGASNKGGINLNGIGAGTTNPTHPLTVVGKVAIGSDTTTTTQGLLSSNTGVITAAELPFGSTTRGIVIESPIAPGGGHVIVGLNSTSNENESFSVIGGTLGNYITPILTVKADSTVGIGNKNPTQALTVTGNISGSGNLDIEGYADIGTAALASSYSDKVLTLDGTRVKQALAAPIPIGGIIMWSGAVSAIPTGWSLCNGSNGTPDLRNRFVVGAGSTYDVDDTGGSADAVVVSHTHTGATTSGGGHFHSFNLRQDNFGSGDGASLTNNTSGNDEGFNTFTTNIAGAHSHGLSINNTGESGTGKNLPPYYALAYIMYTG